MSKSTLPAIMKNRNVDEAQYNVLKNMIFPGCKDDEVLAVAVDYCKARKLDILKKPCHIVPVWNSDKNRFVDTVWPSIYEYRITASRTGVYAGKDEPEFGEDVTKEFGNDKSKTEFTFPKWCKITVYKLIDGHKCAFTGKVFWEECVVIIKKTGLPNSMWQKRIYSQLAKCAEAEALRAAFPDELGGLVTAEEMEGRDVGNADAMRTSNEAPQASKFQQRVDAEEKIIDAEVVEEDDVDEDSWDGKSIIVNGKAQQLNFNDSLSASNYLKGILNKRKSKQSRIDLINENLALIKALSTEGHESAVASIHAIADQGE